MFICHDFHYPWSFYFNFENSILSNVMFSFIVLLLCIIYVCNVFFVDVFVDFFQYTTVDIYNIMRFEVFVILFANSAVVETD